MAKSTQKKQMFSRDEVISRLSTHRDKLAAASETARSQADTAAAASRNMGTALDVVDAIIQDFGGSVFQGSK